MADGDGSFLGRRSRTGRTLGAVLGILLLPVALVWLVWTESHAIDTAKALVEGALVVREAPPDRIDPGLEGALIHAAGPLTVPNALADPDFPEVTIPAGTVGLRRAVETYQWRETTARGSVSYNQVWSGETIDSSRFRQPGGPSNTPPRYRAWERIAPDASLGPHRLGGELSRQLRGEALAVSDSAAPPRPGLTRWGDGLYAGRNPEAPQNGDQRISWQAVHPAEVSVVARQHETGFVPYETKSGASVYLIVPGLVSARAMIAESEQANEAATWMGRVAGAGLLFLSLFLILRSWEAPPLAPPGGDWVAKLGPARIAATLTAVVVPCVIGAAWLTGRPVVAAAVLAMIGAALGWRTRRARF